MNAQVPEAPDKGSAGGASRRRFLGAGLAGAGALALVACGGGGGGGGTSPGPSCGTATTPACPPAAGPAPSLDSLAADWIAAADMAAWPSANNLWGSLRASRDVAGFEALSFPPLACAGASGVLWLDGAVVPASASRWSAHQLQRSATVGGIEVQSTLRMPTDERVVATRVRLRNTQSVTRTVAVSLRFTGGVRHHADAEWAGWDIPHGQAGNAVASQAASSALSGTDAAAAGRPSSSIAFAVTPSGARIESSVGAGQADWQFTLAAGESLSLACVAAVGDSTEAALAAAVAWAQAFESRFDAVPAAFEARWQAMFTPGNAVFSGHLPTLATTDSALASLYYHGALAAFVLTRTHLPLAPVVFPTLAPQWGVTLSYFWDSEMFSLAHAMLEPASLKATLRRWLAVDLHGPQVYAVDNLSLRPAGVWYAANDWAVFRTLDAYLAVTGDTAFLSETLAGTTVLERLVGIALAWEPLVAAGESLADYGGVDNLLETAPNYVHKVASLNAGNVYLMRRAAQYLDAAGQSARAAGLRSQADRQRDAVLALYVAGEGVWSAEHADGSRSVLRHCFDYIVVGQALAGDLSAQQRSEMSAFVRRELLAGPWMRAMSLSDPAAAVSTRADHGSTGAFDAWPAMTAEVMCRFGHYADALGVLRRAETLLREGPFAQSHQLLEGGARARITGDFGQDYNEICGGSFLQTVLKGLFGLDPGSPGAAPPTLRDAAAPRGVTARLDRLTWGGRQYQLLSDAAGVRAEGA